MKKIIVLLVFVCFLAACKKTNSVSEKPRTLGEISMDTYLPLDKVPPEVFAEIERDVAEYRKRYELNAVNRMHVIDFFTSKYIGRKYNIAVNSILDRLIEKENDNFAYALYTAPH